LIKHTQNHFFIFRNELNPYDLLRMSVQHLLIALDTFIHLIIVLQLLLELYVFSFGVLLFLVISTVMQQVGKIAGFYFVNDEVA